MSRFNSVNSVCSHLMAGLLAGVAFSAISTSASAQQAETVTVTAERLAAARNGIQTQTGASTYTITSKDIENQPGGANTALNQVILQTPGVAQDSSASCISAANITACNIGSTASSCRRVFRFSARPWTRAWRNRSR